MNSVIVEELSSKNNRKVLILRLNSEKTLNALSLAMIDVLEEQLQRAAADPQIAAVVMEAAGEKAFCAGGDVVGLYKALIGEDTNNLPEHFFSREYHLDQRIHNFSKPIICWANGIVFGGGMGLMNGCSHRLVTETSMLAMPELSIGFYPDVGASWFLNRMPGRIGLFLALTASRLNAADAIALGLAERLVHSTQRAELKERLANCAWQASAHSEVSAIVRTLEQHRPAMPDLHSSVQEHAALIRDVTDFYSITEIYAAINALETDNPWLQRARKMMLSGSPLALTIIYRQLQRSAQMSLTEVFACELALSVRTTRCREFQEGVRAQLVDKDAHPDWCFKTLAEVDVAVVDDFFRTS